MSADKQEQAITHILDELAKQAKGEEDITVEDILHMASGRAYGPLLLPPGLALVTPVGAIPLVPAILAVFILLISLQMAVGKRRPWVPRRLRERGVDREKALERFNKARPWAEKVERFIHPRLTFLSKWPVEILVGGACSILALAVIPLGFVPFANMIPGLAFCCFGVALIGRDGLLMIFAFVFSAAAIGLAIWALQDTGMIQPVF
jgi:hypothetical protein